MLSDPSPGAWRELRADRPIGIFDSGLGGLTVAAAIAAALPNESMVYLGDTARVPYGSRSPATIRRYAASNLAFLDRHEVKLVVVACNTVSAQSPGTLRAPGDAPVVEVVAPGARAALAASAGGEIAVLGTRSTILSGAYGRALRAADRERAVLELACPLFVPLVEEGFADHAVTRAIAQEYLRPLTGRAVDTIVLGCTHYPLLREVVASVASEILGRPVAVVDSARAVAAVVAEQLAAADALARGPATRTFYVTDHPDRAEEVAGRFWGTVVGGDLRLTHVDLAPPGAAT